VALVLLVDDDPDTADILKMMLQLRLPGLRFEAFVEAARALEAVEREWPAAIISDLNMPGMTGREFARAVLASSGSGRRLPLMVAVSGNADELLTAGQDRTFHLTFLKPLEIEPLVALLRPLDKAV
jgi:CheY-like chemotaxis protein